MFVFGAKRRRNVWALGLYAHFSVGKMLNGLLKHRPKNEGRKLCSYFSRKNLFILLENEFQIHCPHDHPFQLRIVLDEKCMKTTLSSWFPLQLRTILLIWDIGVPKHTKHDNAYSSYRDNILWKSLTLIGWHLVIFVSTMYAPPYLAPRRGQSQTLILTS